MNDARVRQVAPAVQSYLRDVVEVSQEAGSPVVSVVLFGSAAMGSYAGGVSDVDLVFVVRDGTAAEEMTRLRSTVSALEERHGLGKPRPRERSRLERFADRITANERAFFICTRSDLLSGEPGRILGLPRAQARFVDRVAIPSIVGSGLVLWGEDLLASVPLLPIRRRDVWKACFSLFSQCLFAAAAYPLLPRATSYAMDALKRSIHNCYFCYAGRAAPLDEEVAFLDARQGADRTRARLLELRRVYRASPGFVLSSLVTIARQHARTARDHGSAAP